MSNESLYRLRCREELKKMKAQVEPARNEKIALRAIEIARYFLDKAEKQAKIIAELQNVRPVRCKDCKYYTDGQIKGSEHSYCVKIDAWMKPEDYCSYGARKDG